MYPNYLWFWNSSFNKLIFRETLWSIFAIKKITHSVLLLIRAFEWILSFMHKSADKTLTRSTHTNAVLQKAFILKVKSWISAFRSTQSSFCLAFNMDYFDDEVCDSEIRCAMWLKLVCNAKLRPLLSERRMVEYQVQDLFIKGVTRPKWFKPKLQRKMERATVWWVQRESRNWFSHSPPQHSLLGVLLLKYNRWDRHHENVCKILETKVKRKKMLEKKPRHFKSSNL